ncbi:MAG: reverse transcriptase/maturase family protein [Rhodocyclaceae bacterium]|nr:reverse transcriptase/maturase family protein [Rhodocyclaceae bacterium]
MGIKHDNLIERIADWENLLLAYRKARRGKRRRDEVQRFAADLWLNLGNIQHHLLAGTYRMGSYRHFVVFEPKRREILAAPFADRVVQHAILNVLQPIWNRQMIDHAYACRPGKGTHAGADRLQQWLRDMSKRRRLDDIWVAKTDFSAYFRSIRHDDLKRIVRRNIICGRTLALLDVIIDSTPGGVGIPVGNLTSQWLANLLGNELDQRIKRDLGVKRYLRYMDDCVALFWTKAEAQYYVERLRGLSEELGLAFSKVSVHRASQGINALGYRIWPTHRLLRKRAIVSFRRDINKLMTRGDMTSVSRRVQSFVAHASHADTWRLRETLFSRLPRSNSM